MHINITDLISRRSNRGFMPGNISSGSFLDDVKGFFKLITSSSLSPEYVEGNFNVDPKHQEQFLPYFNQHIKPHIHKFEDKRIETLTKIQKNGRIVVAIWAVVLVGLLGFGSGLANNADTVLFLLFAFLGISGFTVFYPLMSYGKAVKTEIYPLIFKYFGNDYEYNVNSTLKARDLRKFSILPSYDEEQTEDHIKGSYKGVNIELTEAELLRVSRDKDGKTTRRIIFNGLFILFDVHKNFSGKTIIKRDPVSLFNIKFSSDVFRKLKRVSLEDPRFEEIFEVYSGDQVEARYLLTYTFMERLVELQKVFGGDGTIQCSFYEKKLLLMLPSRENKFEVGSVFKTVTFIHEINQIIDEMESIYKMIDVLKLDQNTGL